MIRKSIVICALMLISGFTFAQQADSKNNIKAQEAAAWARAGCGPDAIHFDVKMDKHQHPLAAPDAGKALVYVFADDLTRGGLPTTRVGLDSKWVGGNVFGSYFFLPVAPGSHRLCSNWQGHPQVGAAIDFTAEAGKTYFFQAKILSSFGNEDFKLDLVPEAEGHFMIASHGLSTIKPRDEND
jgi:hypothetical protein